MQDWFSYAIKNGIELKDAGDCQFCGAPAKGGVLACHNNTNYIAELLDYNDPINYTSRFLSVDAMALQHYELHGPWNNYIHFARLVLIFEKKIDWNYMLTPLLSNVVNEFKRDKKKILALPAKQRGRMTTVDLMSAQSKEACRELIRKWAHSVYEAFQVYRPEVEIIVSGFIEKR